MQEVLRSHSVSENSFGKVCTIIDKVSHNKILAAWFVHIDHQYQTLMSDYVLISGYLCKEIEKIMIEEIMKELKLTGMSAVAVEELLQVLSIKSLEKLEGGVP